MSTEILNNLCQLTTPSLKRLKTQIDDILRSRVDQVNESFIDHIENFCDDDTLLSYHKFYYIDVFHRFAIPFNARRQDDPRCRNEKLFEKSGIHPNVLRGMGALARLYIKALHSSYFNPFCIQ